MKIGLSIVDDRMPQLQQAMEALRANTVSVGVADSPRSDSELTNGELAYVHEYGEPAQGIPARPALAQGLEAALPATGDALEAGLADALDGNVDGAIAALAVAGAFAVESIKHEYESGEFAALSPERTRERLRAGTGVQPLYDTHQLAEAVEFELVGDRS